MKTRVILRYFASYCCFYCKKLHNSTICSDKTSSENGKVSTNYASNISSVLLQTADLVTENPLNKNQVKVKCLFDQGAHMSFLTGVIKHVLNLKTISKEKTSINAFSSKRFETTELEKVCINLKINSCGNFSMEVLCKPFICLPITNQPVKYAENNFEFLKDLNLADSGTVEEIDMFIGSNFYWSLATGKVKMGKTGEPVAIKTKFGWVLYEPLNEKASQVQVTVVNETKTHVLNLCFEPTKISDPTKTESLEIDLKKLWDLETLDIIQKKLSMHDHFIKSIHLNNERRCETNLPFKENLPVLYDHFDLCKNRLEQLFKKLENDKELLKKYNDVFSEQLKQGIIEEAPKDFKVGECQYLSHHAVFRED